MIITEMVVANRIPEPGVPGAVMTAGSSRRPTAMVRSILRRPMQTATARVVAGPADSSRRRSNFREGNAR
jgi:hypothetical protein